MLSNILILAAGIAAIAWVNWYFFFAGRTGTAVMTHVITVEGGYSPSLIRLQQGTSPVRLIFDRKEKSPCSDEVVFSDFGIRHFLKPFDKTVVELTPSQPGTYEFTCGMNMLRGRIEIVRKEV